MRSLELCLKRLEEKRRKKNTQAPTRHVYDVARARDRTRNLYSAKLKLYRIAGRDEDELWHKLSDRDRETLENDTPEQRARDANVIERSRGVHDPGEAEITVHADRCLQKLRSMERTEEREWPPLDPP